MGFSFTFEKKYTIIFVLEEKWKHQPFFKKTLFLIGGIVIVVQFIFINSYCYLVLINSPNLYTYIGKFL